MSRLSTKNIILNADASIVYLPSAQAMVHLGGTKPNQSPSSPVRSDFASSPYKEWGDDNDYPGGILEKVNKNSIIPSTLSWKANQMSAGGILYGAIRGRGANGTEIFEPLEIPEIDDWMEENAPELFLEESLRDLYWWNNTFVDLYLDKAGKKIASVIIQEAIDCRFSRMTNSGKKDFVFLDGNWPNGKAETWTKVPCLDPYYAVQDQIIERKSKRYIYPLSFSSPGDKYQQKASWHSIIESGWLDVAEKIPIFKKSLMDNQMSIKYIIHVPESWWKWKYKNWDKLTDVQKTANQNTVLTEFNNVLTGIKNVGKTLLLTFKHDAYGKQFTKWEVIPLMDKVDSGAYVEDSQEASSHILYSLLVDGTLIGNSPGKGMGAGSGSDKLRANNIFIINNKVYLEKALKPMYIISKFNNWKAPGGEKIHWRGQSFVLATLDSGKTMQADNAPADKKDPIPDNNK